MKQKLKWERFLNILWKGTHVIVLGPYEPLTKDFKPSVEIIETTNENTNRN